MIFDPPPGYSAIDVVGTAAYLTWLEWILFKAARFCWRACREMAKEFREEK